MKVRSLSPLDIQTLLATRRLVFLQRKGAVHPLRISDAKQVNGVLLVKAYRGGRWCKVNPYDAIAGCGAREPRETV